MAEQIERLFQGVGSGVPKEPYYVEAWILPVERQFLFGGIFRPIVMYRNIRREPTLFTRW